jgi:dGTPase
VLSRAPYASSVAPGLGRAVPEAESAVRTAFQRDRDRIIHCQAFRRLEYKTQVFANFAGDHFRTRLTHSLEVAQIARTLARALGADEDLAEAIALAHDLGHSPFGHAGETALGEALAAFGGFDHNLQSFRILTRLERRYANFDGLNLTLETLEGVVKHNGPLRSPPKLIAEHKLARAVDLAAQAPLEAQAAAIADDVAYTNHDLDDGLRAGFFQLDELGELPVVGALLAEVDARHPGLEWSRRKHETIRRLIDRMVTDLLAEARRRIARHRPASAEAVRACPEPLLAFSSGLAPAVAALRDFLHLRMYRHYKVNRMTMKARRVVRELVEAFLAAPECLPDKWRAQAGEAGGAATAEAVRDYIAGMTDRFALDEHDRLYKLGREPT